MPPEPGLSALVEITVTDADTAIAMRSGSVPVLATPRVIALVEEACVQAINGSLAPGQTSVGMQVQLDHVNPTLVGGTAVAEATLDKCNGRRLSFTVSVNDSRGLIAAGRVTRVVVDEQRFMEKAAGD